MGTDRVRRSSHHQRRQQMVSRFTREKAQQRVLVMEVEPHEENVRRGVRGHHGRENPQARRKAGDYDRQTERNESRVGSGGECERY